MPRLAVRAGIQEILSGYSIRYVKQQWFHLLGGCDEVFISYWTYREIIRKEELLVSEWVAAGRGHRDSLSGETKWSPKKYQCVIFNGAQARHSEDRLSYSVQPVN